jgi:hypothetical protein
MHMKFRTVGITVAAMLLSLVVAAPASAALVLRIEDVGTGTGAVIFDNGPGDIQAGLGVLTFSGAVGGFAINVTTGISKPMIGSSIAGELDLNSVNVSVSGAGTLKLTLYDTDFSATSSQIQQLVGGTLTAGVGSSITFQTWANLNNLVPAVGAATFPVGPLGPLGGTPAGSVAACGPLTFGPGAFSATCWSPFIGDGQYSIFSQATAVFTGAGTVSFDLNSQATIPEPGSMLLLGSGLLGLAALARRRSRKA